MTWFTPEVIDVIISVVKAIVILLAVVVAGALLSLNVAGVTLRLPLRINEELGAGLVALPAGLAGIPPAIFGLTVDGLQEAAQ